MAAIWRAKIPQTQRISKKLVKEFLTSSNWPAEHFLLSWISTISTMLPPSLSFAPPLLFRSERILMSEILRWVAGGLIGWKLWWVKEGKKKEEKGVVSGEGRVGLRWFHMKGMELWWLFGGFQSGRGRRWWFPAGKGGG
ncbi:uncharacterized protein LOC110703799 [Chenopodium quinoa]|uniref:uncharacterized protein LOC110683246 n=1 Tax=Chenopodium quinoa TaxID=63459 RepID=UPI000B7786C5|nr:uncharacterized protein LOC110683246 [Chenopodium quinoa]XP_021716687.1 uncharacterized protein LOC110684552 [Chenopodium quinoa]XP_021737274.1 uncharacterized protein LOC110703799 [Chenopodium quinoa]